MVAFQRGSQVVRENSGVVKLVVSRSGNTEQPASVDYARTSGTASSTSDFNLAPGTLTFVAGQTTKTIAVTIKNDAAREPRETIAVSLRGPGVGTVVGSPASTTVTIRESDQRPDGWISTAASSGYVGNNIYNTTGYRQGKTLKARRTQVRTFYTRVYNDGNVKNTFVLKGSAAPSGSTVQYYSGTTNATRAMRSAAGWRVTLKPGAYKLVKVRIKVLRGAAVGSLKVAKVSGSWTGDGTRSDLVKAVVKVVR